MLCLEMRLVMYGLNCIMEVVMLYRLFLSIICYNIFGHVIGLRIPML